MNIIPPHADSDKTASNFTFIYRLRDPETQEIRYIGKANDPDHRLRKHIEGCKRAKSRKNSWIISLVNKGLRPVLEIIEKVSVDCWEERECYWIAYYRAQGMSLTNGTDGGDGSKGLNLTEEQRRRYSKASTGRKMPPRSEEWKRRQSEAQKRAVRPPCSEETKQKISESHKVRAQSEEARRKRSIARTGTVHSEETKRKMSEDRKGRPGYRKSEEHKRKLSESIKGHIISEETRQKISETLKRRNTQKREQDSTQG